ncbi:PilZ domain-containing protein [Geothrix sp. PMB-07]|uniref:PilZ domain-containing protein n=1 Tax=Geothrix sp. PMB-07 TaxID=3068640 RepID=UPI002741597D|nr:PilZ domain-containing protein [Geothrix sp. PMB-07]WLT29971.1 PilZ domain-containing protein [Geothrix sp. PMB-07]
MSTQEEKRKYPRLSISDRSYGIRLRVNGSAVQDLHLVNLSAGGCGLEIQMAEARYLEMGDLLESVFLDHPDLPFVPLSAAVVRMLGKVAGKTGGYVLVGLEFQEITPFVRDLIADHVMERLKQE